MLLFNLSPGLSHLPAYLKCASSSIAGRDIRLMFASLPSPRSCFTVFNKQGFTSVFSNFVSFFAWQFQVRLHMMPVLLGETSSKIV